MGDRVHLDERLWKQFGEKLYHINTKMIETNKTSYFYYNYNEFYKYLPEISDKNTSINKWLSQKKFELLKSFHLRVLNPCGMSIAFIAPDGAGKSTVIEEIMKTCAGLFQGIEYKYFRPRLFQNPGPYNIINPNEEAKG